jgi:glycosyltransferase involved in cell wall biosynthesis
MLVSVVIPAYNAAEWISETLESVIGQTYRELEVILVDDGSTDDTGAIAEEKLKGALQYRILRQANSGAAAARNNGWQAANGAWIQFLDADDLLDCRKIELQIGYAKETADVIYSNWQKLVFKSGTWQPVDLRTPQIHDDALADILSDRNFLQLGSLLFRRNILCVCKGFDASHQPIEDVGLCVKIAIAGGTFVKAPSQTPIAWYRDLPRSFSKINHRKFIESCIKNAKLAERHLKHTPHNSARVREAIVNVYFGAARYYAGLDWIRFGEIVSDIEALDPSFVPKAPVHLKLISQIVGYRNAERIATVYRRAKLWRTQ